MSRIELIGISAPQLSSTQRELLDGCAAVVVSRRHHPLVEGCGLKTIAITPLAEMISEVERVLQTGSVAIFASGDPLFYGIGRTLFAHFAAERIRVHPALSAMQLACARFKVPWDDLHLISLHGRPAGDIPGRVLRYPRVLLFTDQCNSPDRVAATLLAVLDGFGDRRRSLGIRVRVAEDLQTPTERLSSGTLAEIAAGSFSPLNVMLIEQPEAEVEPFRFGLRESAIHHSRGLITKDEVRAAALHRLQLPHAGVLWDIGGGSGSLSVEAARLNPGLSICTVEKNPAEQANIRANVRSYGTYNIQLVCGEAPQALDLLPAPCRVFVGGSGQRLAEILAVVAARLTSPGRVVVNAVRESTAATALQCLQQLDFQVESSTLAVTRRRSPDGEPTVFNPITIITGST